MKKSQYTTVAIVDNDKLVLRILASNIQASINNISVIWTAATGSRAVEMFSDSQDKPDIILVDMSMEDMSGVDICHKIRQLSRDTQIVAITAFSLSKYAKVAAQAGAQGIVDKANLNDIVRVIQELRIQGKTNTYSEVHFLSAQESHLQCASYHNDVDYNQLTKREIEVLNICSSGYTLQEASVILHVSVSTTKTHMRHAIAKLGVRNKAQAVAKWTHLI